MAKDRSEDHNNNDVRRSVTLFEENARGINRVRGLIMQSGRDYDFTKGLNAIVRLGIWTIENKGKELSEADLLEIFNAYIPANEKPLQLSFARLLLGADLTTAATK